MATVIDAWVLGSSLRGVFWSAAEPTSGPAICDVLLLECTSFAGVVPLPMFSLILDREGWRKRKEKVQKQEMCRRVREGDW
jgi:hypothetical protein